MTISLSSFETAELIQITKRGQFWNIVPGWWWHGRNDALAYSPKEDVLFDLNDLVRFINEIKKIIKEKPQNPAELLLTFQQNKARLKIFMHFMTPESKFYEQKYKDKFCVKIGIDVCEAVVPIEEYPVIMGDYDSAEGVNMENSTFRFLKDYYTAKELKKFVEEIEKEAGIVSRKGFFSKFFSKR